MILWIRPTKNWEFKMINDLCQQYEADKYITQMEDAYTELHQFNRDNPLLIENEKYMEIYRRHTQGSAVLLVLLEKLRYTETVQNEIKKLIHNY